MTQSSLHLIAQQEKTRREILHKSDLIPPLPDLVSRLLGLLNNKDAEPKDLERLLQNDQVLVAKMLAMVNSPFYGMNRTIRTIKEAVMVLGFRGVRSLVLATSTAKFLQRDFTAYGHEPKGLWLHAVCVAAGSRELARRLRICADDCEQLFVAGLLHDIGKLLLVPYLGDVDTQQVRGSSCEIERNTVGLDHAEAGALVAAKWNLAEQVQDVIRSHHDGGDAPVTKNTVIVQLADLVAHELGTGYLPGNAPHDVMRGGNLKTIGLSDDAWHPVRDELAASMEEAVLALGDLGS